MRRQRPGGMGRRVEPSDDLASVYWVLEWMAPVLLWTDRTQYSEVCGFKIKIASYSFLKS